MSLYDRSDALFATLYKSPPLLPLRNIASLKSYEHPANVVVLLLGSFHLSLKIIGRTDLILTTIVGEQIGKGWILS